MKTRKILAVLLSIAMLFSLMTQAVWAEDEQSVAGDCLEESSEADELPELPDMNLSAENDTGSDTGDFDAQNDGLVEDGAEEEAAEPENSADLQPEIIPGTVPGDDGGEISPMSLLPLRTVNAAVTLDRISNCPPELESVSPYAFYVREVLTEAIMKTGGFMPIDNGSGEVIMYASEEDNYVQVGMDDIVEPSERYISSNYDTNNRCAYVSFIVGDGNQLNPNNIRYEITIEYILTETDFFKDSSMVIFNQSGEELNVANSFAYFADNMAGTYYTSYCYVSKNALEKGGYPKTLIKLGEKYGSANVEVYTGFVHSDADIGDKENIASKILYNSASKEPVDLLHYDYDSGEGIMVSYLDLTFVLTEADGSKKYMVAQYNVYIADNAVRLGADGNYTSMEYLYKSADDHSYSNAFTDGNYGIVRFPVGMYSSFDELDMRLYAYYEDYIKDNSSGSGVSDLSKIDFACFGNYESEEAAIAAGAEDVKNDLFGGRSSAGKLDFSQFDEIEAFLEDGTKVRAKVINVTVTDIYGFTYNLPYYIALAESLPESSADPYGDAYFNITGVMKADGSEERLSMYKARFVDDSYSRNGYRTVFLLDNGQAYEGGEIIPVFDGNNVHMDNAFIADASSAGDDIQISGKSKVIFKDGKTVQYAVKSGSENSRYYWVTYLTQTRGSSKLFVNAASDEEDKVDGEWTREIFFNEDFGYNHDILIANTGDQPLTGITVSIKDNKGIDIDPYWTVASDASANTLGAFTDTESRSGGYELKGELDNLAKIRLLPSLVYEDVYDGLYNESGEALYEKVRNINYFGEISGTLVISADGNEPVEIKLTGIAGKPKITTEGVLNGVKYVPYSCFIMTNSKYDSGNMKFSIVDGALPEGIELLPDGELYGIPTVANDEEGYTFTVEARYVGTAPPNTDISEYVDYRTYNIKIANNDDANVDAVNTEEGRGYVLKDRVSKYVTVYYSGVNGDGTPIVEKIEIDSNLFHSEGELGEFKEFYIDGIKLEKGVDYTVEEGSTKITVLAQTFSHIGLSDKTVAHTLAAEFRNEDRQLKDSAQNVYLEYIKYKEQQNQGGSWGGVSGNYPAYTEQVPDEIESVNVIMTFLDVSGSSVPSLKLELHSKVQFASTDDSGDVKFDGVEFGRHTLYATDTAVNKTVSKEFTLVSGFGAGLDGDIVTAEVGQTVHIIFEYDGDSIRILGAETMVDVPTEAKANEDEVQNVDVSTADSESGAAENTEQEKDFENPGTGLVLGLVPATILAWALVFIKRR